MEATAELGHHLYPELRGKQNPTGTILAVPAHQSGSSLARAVFGFERKVNHHDGVLFYNADQHDNAYERIEVELLVENDKCEQRPYTGGR